MGMCYFYLSEGKIKVFRVRSVLNGYVGRTHIIVRFQTRSRRKHGTENFGGFIYVLDGFPQRDFVLWVFMCPINIIPFLSLVYISATTPRATTPHQYRTGYHAFTTTAQLSRLRIYPGYHAKGYHAPYLPPRAITPVYSSRLSHQSYHAPPYLVHRVITPAIVVRIF